MTTPRFFLDSGDPKETERAIALLGELHGQTTNPSLVAKHPEAQKRLTEGRSFTSDELLFFYKDVVREISRLIPNGSVSIEVYADAYTSDEDMVEQAQEMVKWIPNAHMKFPTTTAGLSAAAQCIAEGIRVNMTLCFTQQQAAAVYAATRGAKKGDVFVSPFIGRLDDIGQNGLDLVANTAQMYREEGDGHVEILAASTRSWQHVAGALAAGAEIVTAPIGVIEEWVNAGRPTEVVETHSNLQQIHYIPLSLDQDWAAFDIQHELTDRGIERFAEDWNALIGESDVPQKENRS